MKLTQTKIFEEDEVVAYICDKCKTKIWVSDLHAQEMLHLDFIGGYTSKFGDGIHIKCDICDNCLYDMIKDFYRIEDLVG